MACLRQRVNQRNPSPRSRPAWPGRVRQYETVGKGGRIMTPEIIVAFFVYAIVTSITPGPTNFMLLASGANFGFFRTVPHFLGVAVGFTIMVASVGLGLGALLADHPRLYLLLKVGGVTY